MPPSHNTMLMGAGVGTFYGSLREAYKNPPVPTPADKVVLEPVRVSTAANTMQAIGRRAAVMAAIGGAFSAGECIAETTRGVSDPINTMVGGCLGGSIIGLQHKKVTHMCAGCLGGALVTLAAELSGDEWSKDKARVDAKRHDKRQKQELVQ
ncbi:unnamed protein product [Discosporangium mesarthrocarpum]